MKMVIEDTEYNVARIAYSVGFNSPAPFYDWFLKLTGSSPTKFRKENQKSEF